MVKRIEICGGIAAGKTSLTRILEEEGFSTAVYERFSDNPFLSDFYVANEVDNTFETEIVFVLIHYNLLKETRDKKTLVCDYSLLQDYCYGVNNLQQCEIETFRHLYDYVIRQISKPDFIIYLKCNVDCLLERIKKRGRDMEMNISKEYLQSNIDVLEKHLCNMKNVLVIESDKYNFITKDKDMIVKKIRDYCIDK